MSLETAGLALAAAGKVVDLFDNRCRQVKPESDSVPAQLLHGPAHINPRKDRIGEGGMTLAPVKGVPQAVEA